MLTTEWTDCYASWIPHCVQYGWAVSSDTEQELPRHSSENSIDTEWWWYQMNQYRFSESFSQARKVRKKDSSKEIGNRASDRYRSQKPSRTQVHLRYWGPKKVICVFGYLRANREKSCSVYVSTPPMWGAKKVETTSLFGVFIQSRLLLSSPIQNQANKKEDLLIISDCNLFASACPIGTNTPERGILQWLLSRKILSLIHFHRNTCLVRPVYHSEKRLSCDRKRPWTGTKNLYSRCSPSFGREK